MEAGSEEGWPGPTSAVWRWNLTNVQRVLGVTHLAHGVHPSHGRLLCTHWSHACFEVVECMAAVVPWKRRCTQFSDRVFFRVKGMGRRRRGGRIRRGVGRKGR
ncbi:hypothetical protein DFH06DRAFT_1234686 [Mycena polygramma]|nr:hypothetical protein DFH06DRAFT_1234686 [Mycena polygramma]